MDKNWVFRRLYGTLGLSYNIELAIKLFELGGCQISKVRIGGFRYKDGSNKKAKKITTEELNAFFDGLQIASDMGLINVDLSEVQLNKRKEKNE